MTGLSEQVKAVPLSLQVADRLRQRVFDAARTRPGGGVRLPTEDELAEKYGVSNRTVREAVAVLVYDGLIERRHGSGMFTGDLRRYQHVAILTGTMLDRVPQQTFPFRVCQHVMAGLDRHGLRSRWYWPLNQENNRYRSIPHQYPDLVADLSRGRVAGIVAVSANPHPDWHELVCQRKVPMAGSGEACHARVGLDFETGIRQAVDHLVASGARRLGLLAWRDPEIGQESAVQDSKWHRIFRSALAAHGLSVEPAWMCDDHHPEKAGAGWAGFREIWTARRDKPDGLLVLDDFLYSDAAMAIMEMGIPVPERLRVVALVNRNVPYRFPFPTATIEVDPEFVGEAIKDALLKQMERVEPFQTHRVLPLDFKPEPDGVSARSVEGVEILQR